MLDKLCGTLQNTASYSIGLAYPAPAGRAALCMAVPVRCVCFSHVSGVVTLVKCSRYGVGGRAGSSSAWKEILGIGAATAHEQEECRQHVSMQVCSVERNRREGQRHAE